MMQDAEEVDTDLMLEHRRLNKMSLSSSSHPAAELTLWIGPH